MVEEVVVALAEAVAVVMEGGWGNGRVAVVGMIGEGRWAASGDVAAGGFKAVVEALVVDGDAGGWWRVDRSRMSAASKEGKSE